MLIVEELLLCTIVAIWVQAGWCSVYSRQNMGLTAIPTDIGADVTEIDLSYNNFAALPDDAFSPYPLLTTVTVMEANVAGVAQTSFCNGAIEEIGLKRNDLTEFPDVTCLAASLRDLDLSANKLTSIPQTLLSPLALLKNLYLFSNDLVSIPDFTYRTPFSMVSLNGRFHRIANFDSDLHYISTIRRLHVGGNQSFPDFRTLPAGTTQLKILQINCYYGVPFNPAPSDFFTTLDRLQRIIFDKCSASNHTFDIATRGRLQQLEFKEEGGECSPPLLEGYTQLHTLILTGCQMTGLPDYSALSAPLESITFTSTSLSGTLRAEDVGNLITSCTCLLTLDLTGNSFTSVDDLTHILCVQAPQLTITLTANPIQCTCEMAWVNQLPSGCGRVVFVCDNGIDIASVNACPSTAEATTLSPSTAEATTLSPSTVKATTLSPSTAEATTLSRSTAEATTLSPSTAEATTLSPSTAEATTLSRPTVQGTSEVRSQDAATTTSADSSSSSMGPSVEQRMTVSAISAWNGQAEFGPSQCVVTGFHSEPWMKLQLPQSQFINAIKIQGGVLPSLSVEVEQSGERALCVRLRVAVDLRMPTLLSCAQPQYGDVVHLSANAASQPYFQMSICSVSIL